MAATVGITANAAIVVGSAATVGALVATGCSIYKLNHECDKVSGGEWRDTHETVLIEGEYALLNNSKLLCPVGGSLEIIIDDALALKAAQLISGANNKEVYFHWGSKFINGALAFASGGVIGIGIALGMEIYSTITDNGLSNQGMDIGGDALAAAEDHVISTVAEAAIKQTLINEGGSKILDVVIAGMGAKLLTEEHGDIVLNWLMQNGEPFSWKKLGTNLKNGIFGALAGFAIDQASNYFEREYEKKAGDELKNLNDQDEGSSNNIGILAATK